MSKLRDKIQMTTISEGPGCLGWVSGLLAVAAILIGVWQLVGRP